MKKNINRNDFREYAFWKINKKEVCKMRRVLGLALVFMILGGVNLVLAQDRCECPVLVVGDEWTYKTLDGKEYSLKVADIKGDGYLIQGGLIPGENIRDKNTFNQIFTIKAGKKEISDSIIRKMLNFPLFVGKKWDDKVIVYGKKSGRQLTTWVDFKVDKQELIVTPAGDFNALLIVGKVTGDWKTESGRGAEGWCKFWYSPQVKFVVKREYDRQYPWTPDDSILVKYKLSEK